MILSQLSQKFILSKEIATSNILTILSNTTKNNEIFSLLTVLSILQAQPEKISFSNQILTNIQKLP